MFKSALVAEFEADGFRAFFSVENGMPLPAFQEILNRLTHFCVQRSAEVKERSAKIAEEESKKLENQKEDKKKSKDSDPEVKKNPDKK
jgi:hypothetical protein